VKLTLLFMHKKSNALINETSPYLLQHAYNPVEWMPWGEEALQKAINEDKPILVSIGYSACHWCHVMERESFEDESTAEIMNRHFVNIKIDREERPDIDHLYMDAVQAMTGSGGWPLNVFLTPGKQPFYGGTYFPPVRAYNRMSWKETLYAVQQAYKDRREEIETQAYNLTEHLEASNSFGLSKPGGDELLFTSENARLCAENLLANADKSWGGFGRAPKFPQTFSIQYLLQHYHYTKHQASLEHALLSLDKMIQGGMYDHLGGGFARYSTDEKWLAPHFEKMLYDNALLIGVISDAYLITKKKMYADVIAQTFDFIEKEMLSAEGGFYSALDADSEGVEGKYYTWQKQEVDDILGEDAGLFTDVYNITDSGNWEDTNIPWLPVSLEEKASQKGLTVSELETKLQRAKQKLFNERQKRIRPGLDDKILLSWNALMITACCKAYSALREKKYLNLAVNNVAFLETNLRDRHGNWYHCWKNKAKYPAFLDDFAYLGQAYIQLQQATGINAYLEKAKELTVFTIQNFSGEDAVLFYFTSAQQNDVLVRKKEVYDGATPSGNAVMATNLYYLSLVFDNTEWKERTEKMIQSLGKAIVRYPSSFAIWAVLLEQLEHGWKEIAIIGDDAGKFLADINKVYLPGKIVLISDKENRHFELLKDKTVKDGATLIYLCRNYSCKAPVNSVEILLQNEGIYG